MYSGFVESDYKWQNYRCWQVIRSFCWQGIRLSIIGNYYATNLGRIQRAAPDFCTGEKSDYLSPSPHLSKFLGASSRLMKSPWSTPMNSNLIDSIQFISSSQELSESSSTYRTAHVLPATHGRFDLAMAVGAFRNMDLGTVIQLDGIMNQGRITGCTGRIHRHPAFFTFVCCHYNFLLHGYRLIHLIWINQSGKSKSYPEFAEYIYHQRIF